MARLRMPLAAPAEESPVLHNCDAEAGADGDHDHAIRVDAGATRVFAQSSGSGIVLDNERDAKPLFKRAPDIDMVPAGQRPRVGDHTSLGVDGASHPKPDRGESGLLVNEGGDDVADEMDHAFRTMIVRHGLMSSLGKRAVRCDDGHADVRSSEVDSDVS
jgi:hypothetical protein